MPVEHVTARVWARALRPFNRSEWGPAWQAFWTSRAEFATWRFVA